MAPELSLGPAWGTAARDDGDMVMKEEPEVVDVDVEVLQRR